MTARPTLLRDLGATTAVAAFSLAVAAGFARVFSGWDFMNDLALIVVVGHGLGLLLRRTSLTAWLAVPALALVLVWVISAISYRDTLSWGMVTSQTWELFRFEILDVRDQFRVAVAPVIYVGGWNVLAAIGMAIAVLLADVFAFRADARAETLVPGGVLFVFVGAVGDDRLRITLAVVLIAVGVMTIAVLRAYHTPIGRRAVAVPLRRLWPAAVAIAIIVAATAGFVGPRLPGADAAPLYETRGRGGGVTEVVSPLVDIRSRLTNRSDIALFEVEADLESYWRSSALPEFDGTTWGLPERPLQSTDEALSTPASSAVELRQAITILDLGGSLVPAAPDPFQASGPADLRWVAETSTLITVDDDLERGDVIDVVSALPRFDPDELAASSNDGPGDPVYTSLPDDFPLTVRDQARQVTAGARSGFEAARLLQGWFQREFEYSLEVQSGHGNSAIESFLRNRVGYCEQFAGAYAAMMRTLGYPTRVAVGFTSGTEGVPGTFVVRGKNAHAWPEVWFDDVGWVPFEPTPGRGAAGAENYTGLPAQQDTSGVDAATGGADALVPPTTIARGQIDQAFDPQIPSEFADPSGVSTTDEAARPTADGSAGWWWVAMMALALAALAPAIVRWVRARRTSGDPDHQLARLWNRSVVALSDIGVDVDASQTPMETAAAAAQAFPVISRPVTMLADAVTAATYRPEGSAGYDTIGAYGSSMLRNCQNWARQIDRAVQDSVPRSTRLRRYFSDWG